MSARRASWYLDLLIVFCVLAVMFMISHALGDLNARVKALEAAQPHVEQSK